MEDLETTADFEEYIHILDQINVIKKHIKNVFNDLSLSKNGLLNADALDLKGAIIDKLDKLQENGIIDLPPKNEIVSVKQSEANPQEIEVQIKTWKNQ
jgi:hypothetical protein